MASIWELVRNYFVKGLLLSVFVYIVSLAAPVFAQAPWRLPQQKSTETLESHFATAIGRILTVKEIAEIKEAIKEQDKTHLEYLLTQAHIPSLETFLNLMGRKRREFILAYHEAKNFERRKLIADYLRFKLNPRELASTIYIYQKLSPDRNTLLVGKMLTRSETALANYARQITAWPATPIREHDLDSPPAVYNPEAWRIAIKPFIELSLAHTEFVLIRSQFLNSETAHNTHRHIKGFYSNFLKHLQIVAAKSPRWAKAAYLAHLATTKTQPIIEEMRQIAAAAELSPSENSPAADFKLEGEILKSTEAEAKSDSDKPKRKGETVGEFMLAFSKLHGSQLKAFFDRGVLPEEIPMPESVLVSTSVEYFSKHPKDNKKAALTALTANCKPAKASKPSAK